MKPAYEINDHFQLAEQFVNHTNRNIFLTGKAGSGKTTFLQHIKETTTKPCVVVAPTGVAAINAGGMTIHSFFQLPLGMYIPDSKAIQGMSSFSYAVHTHQSLRKNLRINSQKRKLIRQLELLIIDEVSMVRADLLDAVDSVLKHIRQNFREAFGGVQVLMIGDLYQLPPVVPEEEKNLLFAAYDSPYFFSSMVMKHSPPVNLEFSKIYRQHDEKFLHLLNGIRHNHLNNNEMDLLNSYYRPDFNPESHENFITLCSHHYKANGINRQELNKLPGKLFEFEATIEGNFNETATPTDTTLSLKEGAQVMFIRNDKGEHKRYYNGKIGVIREIDKSGIGVSFPDEEGLLSLEKEEWKNIRYSLDKTTRTIAEKVLGTFEQYPIKLAWAITIHKSQGLTFDKAIIDAGESFTSGQVYVALSRLRSLEGLVLKTPIRKDSIITDHQVTVIHNDINPDQLKDILDKEQKAYLSSLIQKSMQWHTLLDEIRDFIDEYTEKQVAYRDEAIHLGKQLLAISRELQEVAGKFNKELSRLIAGGKETYPEMATRMTAASDYFSKQLKGKLDHMISDHYQLMKKRSRIRKYLTSLSGLQYAVSEKMHEIEQAADLAAGLTRGDDITHLLKRTISVENKPGKSLPPVKKPQKLKKGQSRETSFDMYKEGQTIEEIAEKRMLAPGTIMSHLLHYVKEGLLNVYDFVNENRYEPIAREIKKNDFDSLSEIKYRLDDEYSYDEIRAVLNHLIYLKTNEMN